MKEPIHDVAIIGAGGAGLYAAKTLLSYGYDILILEATDRIGGRVKSATLGDMRVEMGAEDHYQSEGDNPIWTALRDRYGENIFIPGYQGLNGYSMDQGSHICWTKRGTWEGDTDVEKLEGFEDWCSQPQNHSNPKTTLAEDVSKEFGVDIEHRAYHLYDVGFAGGTYGTNLCDLGAQSFSIQESLWDLSETTRFLRDKDLGYWDALNSVWWEKVVDQSHLLLNSPVAQVELCKEGVRITDRSGITHLARQVIITVSIGVLQSGQINFVPELPKETIAAYSGMGMGMGMKVALRFSTPWWETQKDTVAWLVTEGLAGVCWVPSDYKIGSESHILMCYPSGDNARVLNHIARKAEEDEDVAIINAILADLDKLSPQASQTFQEGLVQNWGTHPYTLGVYSFPKVGTYTLEGNLRQILQKPVAERIFFAGEGTHISHPATVPGALHEGQRAANAVHAIRHSLKD